MSPLSMRRIISGSVTDDDGWSGGSGQAGRTMRWTDLKINSLIVL